VQQRLLERAFPLLFLKTYKQQLLLAHQNSVRALLLSSCQRLMAKRNPFTLTHQSPMDKRTIMAL